MYKPKGITVSENDLDRWLKTGATSNKDGNGLVIREGTRVMWEKGLQTPEFIATAKKYNTGNINL